MPLIIGAKSASASGVTIANSCRFTKAIIDYADSYLSRTASTNNNSVGKWTFSCWVKRNKITQTNESNLISFYNDNEYRSALRFDDDDKIRFYEYYNGSTIVAKVTNRLFRDTFGWYHIVLAVDKTVASPDTQIYINGVATTSWSTNEDYTQDESGTFDDAETLEINAQNAGGIGGCEMAHVHFCDGTKYAASDFGEFNEDSPTIWQPKSADDISGLTFGDNGFYLNFEDSADLGADASGNSNDFTATNLAAINQTTDTPTNNFCTFNPLAPSSVGQNLENGNLYCPGPNSPNYWQSVPSTLGARAGKWYWEFKDENSWGDTSNDTRRYGICDLDTIVQTLSSGADVSFSGSTSGYAYMNVSGVRYNGGTISGTDANYPTFEPGDILMCAMDLDNQKLYFGKNGTWLDSSDPTSGATGTGSVADISATATWSPYVETHYGSDNVSVNFGNPIAAPSSGNADGNGYGNFEYAPPSGYLALCTKNLGSDGG